ncbi:hypothetical protein GLOIN_2v1503504 [Rhizophagus clarus]|uniref:Uncharacterized protein n=1 Tax=Rhizophagus clarus TaxID=94130 RepID=A0A8H3LAD1_9GLOM|nr:hypothetical protein GLOIN_2v1503504 [Rhizophagus clarus]
MDDDRRSRTSTGSAPTTFSNAKPKTMDPIRIECKKIEIKPTRASLDTYTDVKLGVSFSYSTREMCLRLNELKDKICIPYDQVTGFRIAEYKELEVSLIPNFNRRFYQNEIEIKAAIGRYRSEIFLNNKDSGPISNPQSNNSNLNNEIYVRFYLNVERGGVIVPQDISFNGIIQAIASRDEEDWKVAKWETKHSDKAGVMDLYLF